mmetsp:Transcript_19050/g.72035  ORF Transcript_19050/g.72035 Transcript_19050/m.72035 type:complete len:326 (-) Transcript_19050:1130-2107(-)|eukprot:scaffold207_cov267-Pinguiococcus_pyrenoidosus.AAC.2
MRHDPLSDALRKSLPLRLLKLRAIGQQHFAAIRCELRRRGRLRLPGGKRNEEAREGLGTEKGVWIVRRHQVQALECGLLLLPIPYPPQALQPLWSNFGKPAGHQLGRHDCDATDGDAGILKELGRDLPIEEDGDQAIRDCRSEGCHLLSTCSEDHLAQSPTGIMGHERDPWIEAPKELRHVHRYALVLQQESATVPCERPRQRKGCLPGSISRCPHALQENPKDSPVRVHQARKSRSQCVTECPQEIQTTQRHIIVHLLLRFHGHVEQRAAEAFHAQGVRCLGVVLVARPSSLAQRGDTLQQAEDLSVSVRQGAKLMQQRWHERA